MNKTLNDKEYKLVKDNDGFDKETIEEKLTEYFDDFDYVVGDWSYGKLRLKGFCNKDNKRFTEYNDYKKVDEYLEKECSYGCKYFILERIK